MRDHSQHHCSAQYFDGVTTDADIANASIFPRRSHMHFAWAAALVALSNHDLFITFCDAVLNHPTGSATCRRSCSWIFAAVKKHSSSSLKLAFASLGTEKVEKARSTFP
jgi:hypothetical protein